MNNLVEHILAENYVEASNIFEDRLNTILEKKLIEKKKMMQAEAVGGRTIAQAIKDMQARGLTPRKASDVLVDPRDESLPLIGSKRKLPVKRKKPKKESLDEAGLGYGARVAHAMTPSEKKQYMSAMRGSIGSALKLRKSILAKKPDQSDHEVDKAKETERPGIIARNLNTLVGRKPEYKAKPKRPEEKGGRVGKVANLALRGIARFGDEMGGPF